MNVMSEFVARVLEKRGEADPSFAAAASAVAMASRDAMRHPLDFITDDEDRAFHLLGEAVGVARREIEDAEDAEEYGAEPVQLTRTCAMLRKCLETDPHCYDAHTLLALASSASDEEALERLIAIEQDCRQWCTERSELLDGPLVDLWDGVYMRPSLRLESKITELLLTSACYRAALRRCEAMLDRSPADGQGMRHTAALLYARLEDEDGLERLDMRFARTGSVWMHLSRAMLLYKLGRMDAARRATVGLANLCPGAAFFLTNPTYVPAYLPGRPIFPPGGDEESLYATYEADFLVVDTPDFLTWAGTIPDFSQAVEAYGRSHGDLWA